MNYTNEAIKKAIKKGYIAEPCYGEKTFQGFNERNRIFLDPCFWLDLGMELGWNNPIVVFQHGINLLMI